MKDYEAALDKNNTKKKKQIKNKDKNDTKK